MLCITLVAWLAALGAAPGAKVWEAPLVLPTYELGAADPNPALGGGERRPIYPYPMLDSLTSRRIEKFRYDLADVVRSGNRPRRRDETRDVVIIQRGDGPFQSHRL